MAGTPPPPTASASEARPSTSTQHKPPQASSSSAAPVPSDSHARPTPKKRRNKKKKKSARRPSFAEPSESSSALAPNESSRDLLTIPGPTMASSSFYGLGAGRNVSSTSLESEALLDHREQPATRHRRLSAIPHGASSFAARAGTSSKNDVPQIYRNPFAEDESTRPAFRRRKQKVHASSGSDEDGDYEVDADDRTPLMGTSYAGKTRPYGASRSNLSAEGGRNPKARRSSTNTSRSSRRRRPLVTTSNSHQTLQDWDVNNPPSVPGSPNLDGDHHTSDVMIGEFGGDDAIIDIDPNGNDFDGPHGFSLDRRRTFPIAPEEDVCYPIDHLSEIAEDEIPPSDRHEHETGSVSGRRRRRGRRWPDLSALQDWAREEQEQRSAETRTKKISEPMLIGGRLRPSNRAGWHRTEEDAPYRFTYFNEEFGSTIHSQTISELVSSGNNFRELFIPDPPELSDDESEEEEESEGIRSRAPSILDAVPDHLRSSSRSRPMARTGSVQADSKESSGDATPLNQTKSKPKRFGARPIFWLDVLSPTAAEMKVFQRAFNIHSLTCEDILHQEAREKVELFNDYYFVNYRTFEQDTNSEDFLEPVDMYVVVFREGVISFHFSMTPHPANVRRRIRQLKDFLILSSDWISYAIIDDITDAYVPLIESIEDDVDDIDDVILELHTQPSSMPSTVTTVLDKVNDKIINRHRKQLLSEKKSNASQAGDAPTGETGGDMLRRVGSCRKKVMSLYRLLGNKADVIKGFAKRCNEQWQVAPRSEIGLYLGDIQDHIITMTGNLSHYEKILARAHGNYLAQINIRMNERQEQTADVLGRLTVLGTIVLPMNIITGLWGMNCLVPGQDVESLTWFWCSMFSPVLFEGRSKAN
ncbi:MAG: CorA metal ion transporter [Vezdaea aestivalis]|nr:MAG: CorA metal ion transporter [Vezdaea aestivalis]